MENRIRRTNLSRANLSGANLMGADFIMADLIRALLYRADLSHADYSQAYLEDVRLISARLDGTNMSQVGLSGADLRQAKLTNSVMLNNFGFSYAVIDAHTDLSGALIDSQGFLEYLRENGCQHIPDSLKYKQELERRLAVIKYFDQKVKDQLLDETQLPENLDIYSFV